MINKGLFTSNTDNWATPQWLFDKLNEKYNFTLDVCASNANKKCEKFFSLEDNGLKQDWSNEVCWCNPPYSELKIWVEKAFEEAKKGIKIAMLIPARTDTIAFHKYILPFSGINSANNKYAYVAGLIDGEGCIRIDKKNITENNNRVNPGYGLMLSVKMTDYKIIEYLKNLFNVGSIYTEKFDYKKDTYRWYVSGSEAKGILELIYPFLKVKKSQAFYGINFQILKEERETKKVTEEYLEKSEEYYNIVTNLKTEDNIIAPTINVEFLKGRLKFGTAKNSAPFPSMIVIFN